MYAPFAYHSVCSCLMCSGPGKFAAGEKINSGPCTCGKKKKNIPVELEYLILDFHKWKSSIKYSSSTGKFASFLILPQFGDLRPKKKKKFLVQLVYLILGFLK